MHKTAKMGSVFLYQYHKVLHLHLHGYCASWESRSGSVWLYGSILLVLIFFKTPLDKLNFVVDIKNLIVLLWETEFRFCLCPAVWVFGLCFVGVFLVFKVQCSLKNKPQINYGF